MLFCKFTSKCEWHIKFFNVILEIVPARLYKICKMARTYLIYRTLHTFTLFCLGVSLVDSRLFFERFSFIAGFSEGDGVNALFLVRGMLRNDPHLFIFSK